MSKVHVGMVRGNLQKPRHWPKDYILDLSIESDNTYALVDRMLHNLQERYKLPSVLCFLSGKTEKINGGIGHLLEIELGGTEVVLENMGKNIEMALKNCDICLVKSEIQTRDTLANTTSELINSIGADEQKIRDTVALMDKDIETTCKECPHVKLIRDGLIR